MKSAQGLDYSTLTAEAKYPINSTRPKKGFVLSLNYNRSNSILFASAAEVKEMIIHCVYIIF